MLREDLGRRRLLYKLATARSDIQAARQVARYAEEHVRELSNELWAPLQDAIVISYARPFTANKPHGSLPARWARFDKPRDQELHDELVRTRNELVAHADASARRVVIFPPNARPPLPIERPTPNDATLGVIRSRRTLGWFGEVRSLCDDLFQRLHAAVQVELQTLFGAIPSTTRPFNLLTGEEEPPPDIGMVLAEESIEPPPS